MKSLHWFSTACFLPVCAISVVAPAAFGSGQQSTNEVPFSAETVNQTTRVLGDGNRIDQETHGRLFRDSEGRSRTEDEIILPDGSRHVYITIYDPVQKVHITLDSQNKTATIHHLKPFAPRNHVPAQPPPAPSPLRLKPEPLGTKEIEGFMATGRRFTRTIEAGKIGNEKPIVSVNEIWDSKELQAVLLETNDDPERGQSTRRLTNIVRGEPDPSLFQIPADYTVNDNQ